MLAFQLLDNPNVTLAKITQVIKGPDFPTNAEIITPKDAIRTMYETGNGSIRMRAVYTIENHNIVITALPYQVSGAKVVEPNRRPDAAKKITHGG